LSLHGIIDNIEATKNPIKLDNIKVNMYTFDDYIVFQDNKKLITKYLETIKNG